MFIENLEKKLKEKNISMNKLAEMLEISQAGVSKWKHGAVPGIDKLVKICEILEVSADELLDLSPPGKEVIEMPKELERDERLLLKYYRECSDTGKDEILEIITRKVVEEKPKSTESSNLQVG